MNVTQDSDRLKEIFAVACNLSPESRGAYLDKACGSDAALRLRIEEMLARQAATWVDGASPDPDGTRVAAGPVLARAMNQAASDQLPGVLLPGALIDGKYRIDRRIGAGGMGVVYRATQVALERPVALKVLTSALVIDDGARQRFEREAVAMARLKHPNIVSIYDFGVSSDAGAYFVMEMMEGRSLATEIDLGRKLSIERSVRVLGQACQAVQAAHDAGIIHRDLKPDNIFLEIGPRGSEIVKVLDFGIAKLQTPEDDDGEQLTHTGALIGTPAYMSPEQCRGERLGLQSDIYSLGCVLYQCLTGETPFVARSAVQLILKHINENAPPPSTLDNGIPPEVDDVVLRALAKSPTERYASVAEFEADLRRASGISPTTAPFVSGGSLPTPVYPTTAVVPPLGNLTEPITSFVARDADLDGLVEALGSARLVTLVGPGGIGKTRLALEAGRRMLGTFSDGVWLIELRPIAEPESVTRAIATTLNVKEEPDRPLLDTLGDALRKRAALVILDTCEHLVDAISSAVDSLLRTAPRLRILATSREALNVAGETLWQVSPLDLPDLDHPGASVADIMTCGSMQLFVERARRKRQSFELTPQTVESVARLVSRLDGIPLAIELAASRVSVVSIDQMLARMDDRFALLTSGGRSGRQPALRATVDWSYGLLAEPERALLQRMSVFAGGCTLEAAEEVCAGDAIHAADILDVLAALIDKSLVMVSERDEQVRYRMLETIREYAAEKLDASGREGEVRERYFGWVLAEAEATRLGIIASVNQKRHLDRCEREHDNIRSALRWSIRGRRNVNGGLLLAARLCHFWDMRSHASEGLEWLLAAQDAAKGQPPTLELASAMFSTGFLFSFAGNAAKALDQYEQSLEIGRDLGDLVTVATALDGKGDALIFLGRFDDAESCIREGIELRTTHGIGKEMNLVVLEFNLGLVAMERGDYAIARDRFEATLVRARDIGDDWRVTLMLHNLGEIGLRLRDLPYARRRFEEAEATAERIGFRKLVGYSRIGLGLAIALLGDAASGRERVADGLSVSHASGEMRAVTFGLEAMAVVAAASGQFRRALVIEAAARAVERRADIVVADSERAFYDELLAPVRAEPGSDADSASSEGASMSMDAAIRFAVSVE